MRTRKNEMGLIAGALLFALFAATMLILYSRNAVTVMDEAAFSFATAIRAEELTAFFRFLTHFGGGTVLAPLGVVLVIGFYIRGHRDKAVIVFLTLGVSELINEIMKLVFARARPDVFHLIDLPTSFSFPSGHAMVGPAFYGMLAYMASRWLQDKSWSTYIQPAVFVFIVAVAGSRVYLGVHFLSDVLTGLFLSLCWYFLVRIGYARWESRQHMVKGPIQHSR